MATEKQIEANRQNAAKSSGPRTSEGKARVALNAVKHGLLAQRVVLPHEDEREFEELSLGLEQRLQPVGELEELLVGMIAAHAWRLRRLMLVEKGLFLRHVYALVSRKAHEDEEDAEEDARDAMTDLTKFTVRFGYELPGAYEQGVAELATLTDAARERARRARERAQEAEDARMSPDALLGAAFQSEAYEADAFSRLSRYEAHIQRSMFKALDELQLLQESHSQTTPSTGADASPPLELQEKNGDGSA